MVKGRAETPEERAVLMRELLDLWNVPQDFRLGQLLYNAISYWRRENGLFCAERNVAMELFYAEDDDLLTTVAKFVMEQYPPKDTSSTSS